MLKGFIAGIAVANAFEWVAHKYILHGVHRVGQPRYSPVPKAWNLIGHTIVKSVNNNFMMIAMLRALVTGELK